MSCDPAGNNVNLLPAQEPAPYDPYEAQNTIHSIILNPFRHSVANIDALVETHGFNSELHVLSDLWIAYRLLWRCARPYE
jgi:hypothetical protein